LSGDQRACARTIVNDDLLPQLFGKFLGNRSGNDIGTACGGAGDY
jgi:hypothetical protein